MLRWGYSASIALAFFVLVWTNHEMFSHPVATVPLSYETLPETETKTSGETSSVHQTRRNKPEASSVQTLSRPLFLRSRRPFVKQVKKPVQVVVERQTEPEALSPKPALAVLGISSTPNGTKALIRLDQQDAQWIAANQTIEGWQVEQITSIGVLLKQKKQEARYELFPQENNNPESSTLAETEILE